MSPASSKGDFQHLGSMHPWQCLPYLVIFLSDLELLIKQPKTNTKLWLNDWDTSRIKKEMNLDISRLIKSHGRRTRLHTIWHKYIAPEEKTLKNSNLDLMGFFGFGRMHRFIFRAILGSVILYILYAGTLFNLVVLSIWSITKRFALWIQNK